MPSLVSDSKHSGFANAWRNVLVETILLGERLRAWPLQAHSATPKRGRKKAESASLLEKTRIYPEAHPRIIYAFTQVRTPHPGSKCDSGSPHVLPKTGTFSPHLPASSVTTSLVLRVFAGKNQNCLQMTLSFLLKSWHLGGFALGYTISER